MLIIRTLIKSYKYRLVSKIIDRNRSIKVLDVGCGHDSITICKKYFSIDIYDGIDREIGRGQEDSYKNLSNLFLFDLEAEPQKIDNLSDNYYDLIILSHVIEHLNNGEEVIQKLLSKLSANGLIYVETPSKKTLKYPSGIGFFNFHDDSTHKKVYCYRELSNLLIKNNLQVIKAGIRRDFLRLVFFSPFFLAWNFFYSLPFRRKWDVRGLWDFFGIAQFVFAQKR